MINLFNLIKINVAAFELANNYWMTFINWIQLRSIKWGIKNIYKLL